MCWFHEIFDLVCFHDNGNTSRDFSLSFSTYPIGHSEAFSYAKYNLVTQADRYNASTDHCIVDLDYPSFWCGFRDKYQPIIL